MSWNKEDVYDSQISPLMKQIIEVCKEHQIPMVFVAQFANDEESGPGYCRTTLPFPTSSEHMRDLARRAMPARSVCLAETHETSPDGSMRITIKRVGA